MNIRYGLPLLVLSLGGALLYTHHERWVVERIAPWVQTSFEQAGKCRMHAESISYTLLQPSITFHNVEVIPLTDQSWSWSARHYTIGFSWIYLVLYGMLDLHIALDTFKAQSCMRALRPAIFAHLFDLMHGSMGTLPVFIDSVIMHNAHAAFNDTAGHQSYESSFHATVQRKDAATQVALEVRHAGVQWQNHSVTIPACSLNCTVPTRGSQSQLLASLHADISVPCLPASAQVLKVSGTYDHACGSLCVQTPTKEWLLTCTDITCNGQRITGHITGQAPLAEVSRTCGIPTYPGTVTWQGTFSSDAAEHRLDTLAMHIEPDNQDLIHYVDYSGTVLWRDNQLKSQGTMSAGDRYPSCSMDLTYCPMTHTGTCSLSNSTQYTLPWLSTWAIEPHGGTLSIALHGNSIDITTACTVQHAESRHTHRCSGTVSMHQGIFDAQFEHAQAKLSCSGAYTPLLTITRAVVTDVHDKTVIRARTHAQAINRVQASVDINFLQRVCAKLFGYTIEGDGQCACTVEFGKVLTAHLHLEDGSIRLPGIHNFIRKADCIAIYDTATSMCRVYQGVCQLERGTIRVDGARIARDGDGGIGFAYVPLTFHRCMLTIDHGIFALFSGNVHVTMHKNAPMQLTGYLFIDQAHLGGNIFSHMFQRTLATSTRDMLMRNYAQECICSLTCESIRPISIKTAFFQAHADVTMRVTGKASSPQITGHINLNDGSFLFPYKPLYITRGGMYFDEQDPQDSLVELVASNKIKKYDVSMHISGSLQNNTVQLFSRPVLSEEQILSLLLTGAHEESLNSVMPALIMQNLTSFIFNHAQSSSEFDNFFSRLLKPFDYIRFVPVFADQSGRGGLRGTLEIELNDRLRAMIQKNFSLLEDTRFEIEYAVSDDIVLRGMRNERRDVGGEIEVRWKF